jgi:hypothetical protein
MKFLKVSSILDGERGAGNQAVLVEGVLEGRIPVFLLGRN